MIATQHTEHPSASQPRNGATMNDAELTSAFYGPPSAAIDNSPRAQRLRRVKAAREMLVRKGHTAQSAVFVTAADFLDDSDLEDSPQSSKPKPQVCEVTGHYAAYLIADRTHRLSTDEEIARFHGEQRAREEACRLIEAKNPNNKSVHQTINYISSPGDGPNKVGVPATAERTPARPGRSVAAGDKET